MSSEVHVCINTRHGFGLSHCRLQEEELDIPGLAKTGGKTRFSRTAWGLEIWEMLVMSISLLYEPELQV